MVITNGFQDQTDLNTEELEDRIWKYANEWINKTDLHDKVGGDKKTCFDRIKLMIPTQLKERKVKNRIEVCRIDTTNRAEFEKALDFQNDKLKECENYLGHYPKPIFSYDHTITHYNPPLILGNLTKAENRKRVKEYNTNPKFRKQFKIDEEIRIWKTRKSNAKKTLEAMKFYYSGILVMISRTILQKHTGKINTKEANIRVKKCEKVLENHFKRILKENPKDHEAIRQFFEFGYMFQNPVYDLGKFRI